MNRHVLWHCTFGVAFLRFKAVTAEPPTLPPSSPTLASPALPSLPPLPPTLTEATAETDVSQEMEDAPQETGGVSLETDGGSLETREAFVAWAAGVDSAWGAILAKF